MYIHTYIHNYIHKNRLLQYYKRMCFSYKVLTSYKNTITSFPYELTNYKLHITKIVRERLQLPEDINKTLNYIIKTTKKDI